MKIKFLGTAAAEGVPAIGCCCEVCKKARALGGRNIRSRSQALINNDLLIEFNPDTVWHMNAYGLALLPRQAANNELLCRGGRILKN